MSFGMLVAPNLAPWGLSSESGGLGSTRKETLEVQAWISIDFGRISGPPFGRFWPTLAQQLCFSACVFAGNVFSRFWGLNLDVWGSRIKHLVWKVLQKPAFHICRDYVVFVVIFTWFSMVLGTILLIFCGLGAGLKHHDFRWFSGRPQAEDTWPEEGIWYCPWAPLSSFKQFPAPIQHAKYIMKHAGMKGYEKAGCKLRKYEKSRL